jgi:hypothetical protein
MKHRKKMFARLIITSALASSVSSGRGTSILNKIESVDNKPTTYVQNKDGKFIKTN